MTKKTVLENGLTILTDFIPNFETVSLGFFVNVGSVNEKSSQVGLSHFLEHMAFKGTKTRSAVEISSAIESVGGYLNAYTSKENTAYYSKVLKDDVEIAVDILSDILQNSTFEQKEFEREKGVIIQEIKQTNDSPDDLVFDLFQSKAFEGCELGTPILGKEEDILSFNPSDLIEYMNSNYSTNKMVLAASGNIDHDRLCELSAKFTTGFKSFDVSSHKAQQYYGGHIHKDKDLEQSHVILGFEGLNSTSDEKYSLAVLSSILGGGMSSRLFQEIREKRGLVYSIYSYAASYKDTGIFGIYAACDHDKVREVIEVSNEQLNGLKNSITSQEITKAKNQLKSSLLMGLESSSVRMERLAGQHFLYGRSIDVSEIRDEIDKVTAETICDIADKVLTSKKPTIATVGKSENASDIYSSIL